MKSANEQTFNFEADRWTSAASTRKTIVRLKSNYLLPGEIEKLRKVRRILSDVFLAVPNSEMRSVPLRGSGWVVVSEFSTETNPPKSTTFSKKVDVLFSLISDRSLVLRISTANQTTRLTVLKPVR